MPDINVDLAYWYYQIYTQNKAENDKVNLPVGFQSKVEWHWQFWQLSLRYCWVFLL